MRASLCGVDDKDSPPQMMPRRLMVRLRTLTPSIEVRILTGHPAPLILQQRLLGAVKQTAEAKWGERPDDKLFEYADPVCVRRERLHDNLHMQVFGLKRIKRR